VSGPDKPRPLATPAEVAEWLQVSTERLSKLRKGNGGPPYIKVGRQVRYSWADVHAYCAGTRQGGAPRG
jgi:hypothetical protein